MKIETVESTVYKVGHKKFLTQEEAEQYLLLREKFLNNTYYDVLYSGGLKYTVGDTPLSDRKIVSVPGLPNDNPCHNIAWVADSVRIEPGDDIDYSASSDNTAVEWKVVGQHTFSSFKEFSSFIKDWENQPNHIHVEGILISGLTPEVISFQKIHELAQDEVGE